MVRAVARECTRGDGRKRVLEYSRLCTRGDQRTDAYRGECDGLAPSVRPSFRTEGGREARAHALGLGRARVEHGDAREVKEEEREQQLSPNRFRRPLHRLLLAVSGIPARGYPGWDYPRGRCATGAEREGLGTVRYVSHGGRC